MESNNGNIQVEGIIVGWELHLNSEDQFVLSDDYSQPPMKSTEQKVDFLDYSLGDRITTLARKFNLVRAFY
jgi:hypothetical protein